MRQPYALLTLPSRRIIAIQLAGSQPPTIHQTQSMKEGHLAAWMLTEISQITCTFVVLIGGGFLIIKSKEFGIDPDTLGMVKGLILAWSGFWLGAKVQRQLTPPDVTVTTLKGDAPTQTKVSNNPPAY